MNSTSKKSESSAPMPETRSAMPSSPQHSIRSATNAATSETTSTRSPPGRNEQEQWARNSRNSKQSPLTPKNASPTLTHQRNAAYTNCSNSTYESPPTGPSTFTEASPPIDPSQPTAKFLQRSLGTPDLPRSGIFQESPTWSPGQDSSGGRTIWVHPSAESRLVVRLQSSVARLTAGSPLTESSERW